MAVLRKDRPKTSDMRHETLHLEGEITKIASTEITKMRNYGKENVILSKRQLLTKEESDYKQTKRSKRLQRQQRWKGITIYQLLNY